MAFADWSSLPADLISRIANRFLATSDLDYYMDFRAVCHSWRSATEDPKNSPDPRFRPRHWVNINGAYSRSATRLLVNTITGRFLRKELPLLRHCRVISTTPDGLLILIDNIYPNNTSVLNSFTGYLIRFIARSSYSYVASAALVSGSSPTIILLCKPMDEDFVLHESSRKVYMAEPDSESFAVYEDKCACSLTSLAIQGIYTIGELGSMAPFPVAVEKRIFDLMRFFSAKLLAEVSDDEDEDTMMSKEESIWKFCTGYNNRCFLMESAGELLIILKLKEGMEVYKMDTDSYIPKRVENIGNRAIFLGGYCRCVSVNTDKFPSVDANCIYYVRSHHFSRDYIYMYNLKSRIEERVCGSPPYTIIQQLCQSLK